MTVERLLNEMSSAELTQWIALNNVEDKQRKQNKAINRGVQGGKKAIGRRRSI